MSRPRDLLRAVLIAAPLVAATCDKNALTDLARKVVFDLSSVGFTADRRFTGEYDGERVDWVERVKSAGDRKNIVVELLKRNGRARLEITDPAELAAFDRLAGQLATGGGPRVLFQRDPGPDDLDRMSRNYHVTVIELRRDPVTKAGEPTITYRIDPVYEDRPFYVLTVSTARGREGFPIECQEYVKEAFGVRLASRMVVVEGSLDWRVPSNVQAPQSPTVSRLAIDSLANVRMRAERNRTALFLPKDGSLPPGFELASIEEVKYRTEANVARVAETITLYRFVYSDGVEKIIFIEHVPTDTLPPGFPGKGAGSSGDVALIARFGSITIASLLHAGTLVTIESRVAADRFESMLDSLVRL